MLTLKVIHTDIDGAKKIHLFSGERISHTETEYTDHQREFLSDGDFFLIGELSKSSNNEPYVVSFVELFDGNDVQVVYILPLAECFVMSEGKTVDVFSSYYK